MGEVIIMSYNKSHFLHNLVSDCRGKEEVDGNPGRPVQISTIDGTAHQAIGSIFNVPLVQFL